MPILEDLLETDHGTLEASDLVNNNNAINATNSINVINNTNDVINNGIYSNNNGNDDNSNNINIDIDPDNPNDLRNMSDDDLGMDIDDPAGFINLINQLTAGDLAFITMPDPVNFKETMSRNNW